MHGFLLLKRPSLILNCNVICHRLVFFKQRSAALYEPVLVPNAQDFAIIFYKVSKMSSKYALHEMVLENIKKYRAYIPQFSLGYDKFCVLNLTCLNVFCLHVM